MSSNLVIDLKSKKDKNGQTYFVAKLKCNVLIDASQGITFLVFTSEKGGEQIQIAPMEDSDYDRAF